MLYNTHFNLTLPLRQCRLSECYTDARTGALFEQKSKKSYNNSQLNFWRTFFMKKKFIGLVSIVGILICFASCSNPASSEDNTTYKIEVGVVSNSTYNTALSKITYWSEVSYSNIASLRLYLYK